MKKPSAFRLDILAWKPVRRLVAWSLFPVAFQAAALAVVLLLIAVGLGVGPGYGADELLLLRKTNLTTLVVWGLWWPAMIAIVVALGRAWCTVCPMELVSRAADALARRIGWPRARLSAWLRAGWMTLVLFFALQVLAAGVSLHRVPHFTAWMLIALLALAAAAGLVFDHPRSFCAAFCPAAALLSVYGRVSPVRIDRRDEKVCSDCTSRECVLEKNRHRFNRRSCPSLLRPYNRRESDGCVLCFQCAKVCPHDNIGFGVTTRAAPSRRHWQLLPFEAGFVMVVAGFVAHEVIGEIKWLDHFFHAVPLALHARVPTVPFGWWEGIWFLLLFPLAAWALIAASSFVAGHRQGTGKLLLAAAAGAAPAIALAHLAKAAAKFSGWTGFLPHALSDPGGEETFLRIMRSELASPQRLIDLPLIGWLMIALMGFAVFRAIQRIRLSESSERPAAITGLGLMALMFLSVLVIWALYSIAKISFSI